MGIPDDNHRSLAGRTASDSHSSKPGLLDSLPVTDVISSWVAASSSTPSAHLNPSMRSRLSELFLDYIGITAAAAHSCASTEPIFTAITSLSPPSSTQHCTVLTKGQHHLPHSASLLNAVFAHSLDFDDTHAGATLHPGATTIPTAIACIESLSDSVSIDRFLLSLAIGYEVTTRLGCELGPEAYSRGFHNTSTAGIFGAVATLCVIKSLSREVVKNAFGLAGSRAAGSMQYLDNGSHNKRLHPGFACDDAFVCVTLAEQGVVGATRILEGKMGFLKAYSPNANQDLKRLVDGLGEKWIFLQTSLKPFPACRMTHGIIEMGDELAKRKRKTKTGGTDRVKDVRSVEIRLRTANMSLVGDPLPNKVHPVSEVDGQFSAYFQFAHAYLYGSDDGVAAYQRLKDASIRKLSKKIRCVVDDEDRELGGVGAKVSVEYVDGSKEKAGIQYPLGEEQHPFARARVEEKFKGCMEPVYGEQVTSKVLETVVNLSERKGDDDCGVKALMAMLA